MSERSHATIHIHAIYIGKFGIISLDGPPVFPEGKPRQWLRRMGRDLWAAPRPTQTNPPSSKATMYYYIHSQTPPKRKFWPSHILNWFQRTKSLTLIGIKPFSQLPFPKSNSAQDQLISPPTKIFFVNEVKLSCKNQSSLTKPTKIQILLHIHHNNRPHYDKSCRAHHDQPVRQNVKDHVVCRLVTMQGTVAEPRLIQTTFRVVINLYYTDWDLRFAFVTTFVAITRQILDSAITTRRRSFHQWWKQYSHHI